MPAMPRRVQVSLVLVAALVAGGAGAATPPDAPPADAAAAPVYTRARVASIAQESGGKLYVRLTLLPGWKLPFTTQTFRVLDPALLTGIQADASVKFTARRSDGESTLTSIHVVPPCLRFQPCD